MRETCERDKLCPNPRCCNPSQNSSSATSPCSTNVRRSKRFDETNSCQHRGISSLSGQSAGRGWSAFLKYQAKFCSSREEEHGAKDYS